MAFPSTQMTLITYGGLDSGAGTQIWKLNSTFMSTDLGGVVGALPGIGARPSSSTDAIGAGGGSHPLGVQVSDIVINVPNSAAAIPGRVTLHAVVASTANYLGTVGLASGAFDVTLSMAATASS